MRLLSAVERPRVCLTCVQITRARRPSLLCARRLSGYAILKQASNDLSYGARGTRRCRFISAAGCFRCRLRNAGTGFEKEKIKYNSKQKHNWLAFDDLTIVLFFFLTKKGRPGVDCVTAD